MIARSIQTGPQACKNQYKRSDANETIPLIGAILFWAVALPIASVFFSVVARGDHAVVSRQRRQSLPVIPRGSDRLWLCQQGPTEQLQS